MKVNVAHLAERVAVLSRSTVLALRGRASIGRLPRRLALARYRWGR